MIVDETYFLEHFGVKGQKWGVRRNKVTGVRPIAQKLNDSAFGRASAKNVKRHDDKVAVKADKKWQKNIYSVHGAVAVHNKVADKMNNGGLDKLNNNPKFKGARMFDKDGNPRDTPVAKEYFRTYEKMNERFTAQAVKEVHGISPSGNYKATLGKVNGQPAITIVSTSVEHADVPLPELTMEIEIDDISGMIVYQRMVQDAMEQSDQLLNFLAHYGIKIQQSNELGVTTANKTLKNVGTIRVTDIR